MKRKENPPITSLRNPGIKTVISLRKRRERERAGLIVIEGIREVSRAIEASASIPQVYYCPAIIPAAESSALLGRLESAGASITPVSARIYEKMAYRESSEGICVLAARPSDSLTGPEREGKGFYIVADGIEKPGNLGAIFRSADGSGARGIIVTGTGTDIFNPNVIRASIGTVFSVPRAEMSAEEAAGWLKENGVRIIAAIPDAKMLYYEADLSPPCAIVVGSEDKGVGDLWLEAADERVTIPMKGAADSLNVSVSASILAYEAARQAAGRT